jgi:hypothetical protein
VREDIAVARRWCSGLIIVHDIRYSNVHAGLDSGDWYFIPTTHGLGLSINPS